MVFGKLNSIKILRSAFDFDLVEAKDIVDAIERSCNIDFNLDVEFDATNVSKLVRIGKDVKNGNAHVENGVITADIVLTPDIDGKFRATFDEMQAVYARIARTFSPEKIVIKKEIDW